MAYCQATRKYMLDGIERTANCSKRKNESGTAHADGGTTHLDNNRGKNWDAPMDSNTSE